ncbi:MarR family winged helix-turn-helix transcriptional regulator [Vineibacter terrae]|uniref:MarR family winged helix-turn-helix transcriptional regulator n=1 Tax=Vineibacter terrae TaxID=2586908 RepID=UPI002E37C184|nr:MarR family winged helix-turn-helix transcriptional regulator [Vineibacter terrae]HEX2889698.1 MarR family winged helix-turn-helix transcriptional regulator [Vineibacter terrae]
MLPLDNYIPYLLNRAGARIAQSFSDEMRALGTTLQAWRVLAALRDRDGPRVSELSDRTSIEISTLSRVLDGMETQGLITRRRAADDGRVVTLHVAPAGRRLTDRIVPIAKRYERVAITGLSSSETETLKHLLRRVYANMDGLGSV